MKKVNVILFIVNLFTVNVNGQGYSMPGPIQKLIAVPSNSFTKVSPPIDYINYPNRKSAFISVTYGSGFDNYPQAKAAFQEAVSIWETQIFSPVLIEIKADFADLPSSVLGAAGPTTVFRDFSSVPYPFNFPNTWYPCALANRIAGYDLDPNEKDIVATFNSNFSNWYFGIDGNTPAGKYDFLSVVLHEIGHGLGFFAGAGVQSGVGYFFKNASSSYPFIFDHFTKNGGEMLTTSFQDATVELGNHLQSGNLFCNGYNATYYNASGNPKLYAPIVWKEGSSYAHWDENYFPKGDLNSLMTPEIGYAEAIHSPGNVTKGFFEDMGWQVLYTTGVNDYVLITNGYPAVLTLGQQYQYTHNFMMKVIYLTVLLGNGY